jgi:hypothetical protein
MPVLDEWTRLSARIHGLVSSSELYSSLLPRNHDSYAVIADLGRTAEAICSDLGNLRVTLGESNREVQTRIEAAESRARQLLAESATRNQDVRHTCIRSALIVLSALEAEVSYLLSDRQASIRGRAERAFEHLKRSIVVDKVLGERWRTAFHEARGEEACEKLGAVHLLSHGIWAFKAHTSTARTDLVYQQPLDEISAARSAEGLVLTEWKRFTGGNSDRLFATAREQSKDYASGVLGGTELTRVRYAIVVSEKSIATPDDVSQGGVTYRHINIPVDPETPSEAAPRRVSAKRGAAAPSKRPK